MDKTKPNKSTNEIKTLVPDYPHFDIIDDLKPCIYVALAEAAEDLRYYTNFGNSRAEIQEGMVEAFIEYLKEYNQAFPGTIDRDLAEATSAWKAFFVHENVAQNPRYFGGERGLLLGYDYTFKDSNTVPSDTPYYTPGLFAMFIAFQNIIHGMESGLGVAIESQLKMSLASGSYNEENSKESRALKVFLAKFNVDPMMLFDKLSGKRRARIS